MRRTAPQAAVRFLTERELVVLTGAGMSTDSGIPDYRGPNSTPRTPMTYQQFRSGPQAQRHYWARSHVGYALMNAARPNAGHRALVSLAPTALITQNVDGLHEAAGSPTIALHGRIAQVICLNCGRRSPRSALQERMSQLNPGFIEAHRDLSARPDGDVDLSETADFIVPPCADCGGALKPDVVFFGENVPPQRVQRCHDAVDALSPTSGAMLVLGSSLTVMSGLRFVRRALQREVPVVVVNRGTTRADAEVTMRVEDGCSPFAVALMRAKSVTQLR